MIDKIKKGLKGVKRFMEEKVRVCKNVIRDDKNRLIIGLTLVGLGIGLVASVYMRPPVA
jgi:hypothetical protein